ncbi:MAG: alanine racemase [Balneolales bacterium]
MVRHSSRIELSLSALKKNVNFIRKKIGPQPIISSVVKANAFGHGIYEFVPMAEKCGINHFSVASSFEAYEVLNARTHDSRIMIMGILYAEDLPWVIENEIEFFVYDIERLVKACEVARKIGKKAIIHLELETGGNRTGLPDEDLTRAVRYMRKNQDCLTFEGVCTHFSGIESLANQFRTVKQLDRFNRLCKVIKKTGYSPRLRHTACSAAALAFPETVMDMVRVGTAQFGLWPSPDIYNLHLMQTNKLKDSPLQRVLSWKTDVMHIKDLKKDDFVGYGTSYQASRDIRIAVLPIGYSNGYPRSLSNQGNVLIRGKKAPVVGLINMNVFMVNISNIPDVEVGDEVMLIGTQKKNTITIKSFSEFTNMINNELVSRLPTAIPREAVR